MRNILGLCAILLAGVTLSGCAVAEVGGAVVGATVSVASTAVHVTGDVVSGVADVATGQSDDKDKKDNESLRLRISANTATLSAFCISSVARISAESGRRNGLVAFSSPMV